MVLNNNNNNAFFGKQTLKTQKYIFFPLTELGLIKHNLKP
jgi:hypothetical protein